MVKFEVKDVELKLPLKTQLFVVATYFNDIVINKNENAEATLITASWIDENYKHHQFMYDSLQCPVDDNATVKVRNIYEAFSTGPSSVFFQKLIDDFEEINKMNFEMLISGVLYVHGFETTVENAIVLITPILCGQ